MSHQKQIQPKPSMKPSQVNIPLAHAAMIESMESDSAYADAQAREESTLDNIRLLQHRDRYGNLISMLRPTNTNTIG